MSRTSLLKPMSPDVNSLTGITLNHPPRDAMIRVAIVEDKKSVLDNLSILINDSPNCKCVAMCPSAEEALRILPALKPDVVLMDIHLPGLSGIECVTELHGLVPETQIIMLTVEENIDRVFDSLKAGATGYL